MLVLVLTATLHTALTDAARTGRSEIAATNRTDPGPATGTSKIAAVDRTELGNSGDVRLLNINTWHEGNMVPGGFEMLVKVIEAANPNVVVLQEIFDYQGLFHEKLQSALAARGKVYHGAHRAGDVALLSYWPISKVEPVAGSHDTIVAYHLQAPWPFVVCAVHLDWHHYAPIMPRGYESNAFIGNHFKELGQPVTDVPTPLN